MIAYIMCTHGVYVAHIYVLLRIVFVCSIILAPLLGQGIFMLCHMHGCLTIVIILSALKPSAAINTKSCKYIVQCVASKFAVIVVPLLLTQGITIPVTWQLK